MNALDVESDVCPSWVFGHGGHWDRVELAAGTHLFRFTRYETFEKDKTAPWWGLVDARPDLDDPGLDAVLARARVGGKLSADRLREAYAVMFDGDAAPSPGFWLLRIRYAKLLKPAVCYHGQLSPNSAKLVYSDGDQHILHDGTPRLCIPNLSGGDLVSTGISLFS
jgi:hypothetical protein